MASGQKPQQPQAQPGKVEKVLSSANQFEAPVIEEQPAPIRRVQILASLLYFLGWLGLIAYFMLNAVKTKAFEQAYAEYPTPARIQELQKQAEEGAIVALDCPCSVTDIPRSAYANTTLVEDSFCRAVNLLMTYVLVEGAFDANGQYTQKTTPGGFTDLANSIVLTGTRLLRWPAGQANKCIPASAVPAVHAELLAKFVPKMLDYDKIRAWGISSGRYVSLASLELELAAGDTQPQRELLAALEVGICDAAFGMISEVKAPLESPERRIRTACPGSDLQNERYADPTGAWNDELLGFTDRYTNVEVDSWEGRSLRFLGQAWSACGSMRTIRRNFERRLPTFMLYTPTALTAAELESADGGVYERELLTAGQVGYSFVPLNPRDLDDIFRTRATFSAFIDIPSTFDQVATALDFSSPLPFARADHWKGSKKTYFYVRDQYFVMTGPSTSTTRASIRFAGAYVLYVKSPSGRLDTPIRSQYRNPSGVGLSDNILIGSDMALLLDACSRGEKLQVDVKMLRPVIPPTSASDRCNPNLNPGCWSEMTYTMGDPSSVANLTNASCMGGYPLAGDGYADVPTLVSFPVQCPDVLVRLGHMRGNSSWSGPEVNSPLRFSAKEIVADQQGKYLPFLKARFEGDVTSRAAPFVGLLIDRRESRTQTNQAAYLAACAPKNCTWLFEKPRDVVSVATTGVSLAGGAKVMLLTGLGVAVKLGEVIVRFFMKKEGTTTAAGGDSGGITSTANPMMDGGGGGGGGAADAEMRIRRLEQLVAELHRGGGPIGRTRMSNLPYMVPPSLVR